MLLATLLVAALQQGPPAQPTPAEAAQSSQAGAPQLRRVDLEDWREHLLPDAADLRFARIPWEPTFLDGVRRASEEQRPLLLWLMNGHPLGCT